MRGIDLSKAYNRELVKAFNEAEVADRDLRSRSAEAKRVDGYYAELMAVRRERQMIACVLRKLNRIDVSALADIAMADVVADASKALEEGNEIAG